MNTRSQTSQAYDQTLSTIEPAHILRLEVARPAAVLWLVWELSRWAHKSARSAHVTFGTSKNLYVPLIKEDTSGKRVLYTLALLTNEGESTQGSLQSMSCPTAFQRLYKMGNALRHACARHGMICCSAHWVSKRYCHLRSSCVHQGSSKRRASWIFRCTVDGQALSQQPNANIRKVFISLHAGVASLVLRKGGDF